MEKNLIFVLLMVCFLNLVVFICTSIKRRKKDRQKDLNISMLCEKIKNQEKTINDIVKNLKSKIEERIFADEKHNIKESFKNAFNHTIGVANALEETRKDLNQQLGILNSLLQNLKRENSDKSQEHEKIIIEIEKKIELLNSDYKELRWQIENITKIEEDSKRLNADKDGFQQGDFITEPVIESDKQETVSEKDSNSLTEDITNFEYDTENENIQEKYEPSQKESSVEDSANVNWAEQKSEIADLSNKPDEVSQATENFEENAKSIESKTSEASEAKQLISKNIDSLDGEQSKAFEQIEKTNRNYFITGKAGTGKSYLLRYFQAHTKKRILKVAPTGIAALNIGGTTIHSAFGFNNINNQSLETLNKDTLRLSQNNMLVLKNMDVLIIDEISMVRADTFDKIDKILRIICQKYEVPFGGKQVIVFGDLFQLPPIANKTEEKYLKDKYGGVFFFNSYIYRSSDFSFVELRTNHRQMGDKRFFDILNKIREGTITKTDIDLINQRYVEDGDSLRRVIRLYPKKDLANRVNENELNKIWSQEKNYNAEIMYSKYPSMNESWENNFQLSATLKLKIGAMIMMTRNDPGHRWVNGTLGIVSKLEDDSIFVKIDGYEYEIERATFEMSEAVYENSSITYNPIFKVNQFPLILAYAITIHKSQGGTYQQIACDPSDCFATGQAYVALSRCVDLKGIHLLKKLDNEAIKVDSQVRAFYLSNSKKANN